MPEITGKSIVNGERVPLAVDQYGFLLFDPTSAHKITDMDTAGTVQYFGFTEHGGGWYIMEYDTVANTFRYARGYGPTDYPANWGNRGILIYYYFYEVF